MSDGSNKPAYVPPTIGGELERAGMKYDFESGVVVKDKQKKSRNRNKGSRRDNNNSPTKEVVMVMEGKENVSTVNGPASREHQSTDQGAMILQGFEKLTEHLDKFGNRVEVAASKMTIAAADLQASQRTMLNSATETVIGEVHRKSNEWSKDNIKGDVRRALVHIGVSGVVAGVIALGTYLFRKDDNNVEVTTTDGRTNAQSNGAGRTSVRAQA